MRSIILTGILVTGFFVLSSESCGKKDPDPDLSEGYPDAFTNKIPEKHINQLKKAGVTIYEGKNPPPVSGMYEAEEYIFSASDGKQVGESIGVVAYIFEMDSNPAIKACTIDWLQIYNGETITTSQGGGDVYYPMAGSGANFSIAGMEQVTNLESGKKSDYYSTYSGIVTKNGISNWGSTLYTVDANDNINWIRHFKDSDNFVLRLGPKARIKTEINRIPSAQNSLKSRAGK